MRRSVYVSKSNELEKQLAVLGEQMRQVNQSVEAARQEGRTRDAELKEELKALRGEMIGRLETHEKQDAVNFKHIDDRMAGVDRTDAAEIAVQKYRRWVTGLVVAMLPLLGATAVFLWNNLPHIVR